MRCDWKHGKQFLLWRAGRAAPIKVDLYGAIFHWARRFRLWIPLLFMLRSCALIYLTFTKFRIRGNVQELLLFRIVLAICPAMYHCCPGCFELRPSDYHVLRFPTSWDFSRKLWLQQRSDCAAEVYTIIITLAHCFCNATT